MSFPFGLVVIFDYYWPIKNNDGGHVSVLIYTTCILLLQFVKLYPHIGHEHDMEWNKPVWAETFQHHIVTVMPLSKARWQLLPWEACSTYQLDPVIMQTHTNSIVQVPQWVTVSACIFNGNSRMSECAPADRHTGSTVWNSASQNRSIGSFTCVCLS